jgi:hypothetical protein
MASSLPCNTVVILATSSYNSKETQLSASVWKKLDLIEITLRAMLHTLFCTVQIKHMEYSALLINIILYNFV